MEAGARGRVLASLSLTRPANSLMVGFAVVVGVATADPSKIPSFQSLLGFLTGFTISSYSMVVNDYYDIEVDRINEPRRPLPSGLVRKGEALSLAIALLGLGLGFSLMNGMANFIIAGAFAWIAWLYNAWGKKRGLFGNFMVSSSVAIPYIYGAIAVSGSASLAWFLALTSFLASSGREVVKGIMDVEGDAVRGVSSVARVHGEGFAAKLAASFFLLAVFSTALPIVAGQVGLSFTILILVPNAFFIYLGILIIRSRGKETAGRVKRLALVGMLIGLLVFVYGGASRG